MTTGGTAGRGGRQVILHVGTGKTGSSSIQDSLAMHEDTFAARGIHVLKANRTNPASAKCKIVWNDADHASWQNLRAEVAGLSDDVHTVVFSQEGAFSTGVRGLKRIRDIFAGFDTNVIMYVRDQAEYVQSLLVHQSTSRFIDVRDATARMTRVRARKLDFFGIAQRLHEVFDTVEVRVYSRSELYRCDASADFFFALGQRDLADRVDPIHSNPSMSAQFAAVFFDLDQAGQDWSRDRKARDAALELSAEGHGSKYFMTKAEVEELRAEHALGNQQLLAEFVENASVIPQRDAWTDGPLDVAPYHKLLLDRLGR